MAPRQATLGYVRHGQMALTMFLGKTGEAGPPPQQAKLSFSTKAKTPSPKTTRSDDVKQRWNRDVASDKDKVLETADDSDNVPSPWVWDESSSLARLDGPIYKTLGPSPLKREREESGEVDVNLVPKRHRANQTRRAKRSDSRIAAASSSKPRKSVPRARTGQDQNGVDDADELIQPHEIPTARLKRGSTSDREDAKIKSDAAAVKVQGDKETPTSTHKCRTAVTLSAKARQKSQCPVNGGDKELYPNWEDGACVPFVALCSAFYEIEKTTKRLEIVAHCAKLLRQVLRLTPSDLLRTVLLMVNKLAADHIGIELGIGESLLVKAIAEATGRSIAAIKADQAVTGDLGLIAADSRSNQPTMFKPKPLTVRGVHEHMLSIATTEGSGSQNRKVDMIKYLLSASDGPSEAKFIVRMLEGKLRLGLADRTVLVALAQALVAYELDHNAKVIPDASQLTEGEEVLKSVYSEVPDYGVVIPAVLENGLSKLKDHCKLKPGVPLKPMLANPTKSITEVLDRFEGKDFTCEYKYDGERAQIHFTKCDAAKQQVPSVAKAGQMDVGSSNIFSRNSEDLSKKYPDIIAKLVTWVKTGTKSFVLDCETVAWDVEHKRVLPFQTLMTRKRKNVKVEDVKIKVCVFAFDLLFLNGDTLVNKPFRERRKLLHEAFSPVEGEFTFAQFGDTNNLEEIQNLLDKSVKASCEGLMVKMLDGPESSYEPSRRSHNWLKIKKDYLSGIGDSLDLVVLGAYYGKGKRTSVYGAFLLGCHNDVADTYETICNIGTGFSDELLASLHTQLTAIVIDRPKPFYSRSHGSKDQPDVWFEPRDVWEVKTADLTLSPRYMAAMDALGVGKGVSLRFPRFVRQRDDKKATQATSARQVADMYRNQEAVTKSKAQGVDVGFEY